MGSPPKPNRGPSPSPASTAGATAPGPGPVAPAPAPVRRYVLPLPGEDWSALLARLAAGGETGLSLPALLAWNPHLAYRPPSNPLTPLDVVFLEGPR
ncbi:MAG: hypothetical protein U0900_08875 [Myxococcota bacterium]